MGTKADRITIYLSGREKQKIFQELDYSTVSLLVQARDRAFFFFFFFFCFCWLVF